MKNDFKVLWAIDPQDSNEKVMASTAKLLKALSKNLLIHVEPVFVLTPLPMMDLEIPNVEKVMQVWRSNAEVLLKNKLKKVKLPSLGAGQVLLEPQPSVKAAAQNLLKFAQNGGAELIVLGTHARKGLARFFLGSFAETMMLFSSIPLIVVPPDAELKPALKKILFPTDFSPNSESVFKKFLPWARRMEAQITLCHYVQNPIDSLVQAGVTMAGGGWINTDLMFEEQRNKIDTEIDRWKQLGIGQGVNIKAEVIEGTQSTAVAIHKLAAKMDADMIAMASQSGSVSAVMLGSIARQILRSSKLPVWLIHASSVA